VGGWVMDLEIMVFVLKVHLYWSSCVNEDSRCGLQVYDTMYCDILLCYLDPEGVRSPEILVPTGQTTLDRHNRISTISVPRYLC
jgi:hypothetical protein